MAKKWYLALVLAMPVVFSLPALAAGAEGGQRDDRTEVFGSFGYGRLLHGSHSLGSGMDLGGGFGIRPFRGKWDRLGLEGSFQQLRFDSARGTVNSSDGTASTVSGNLLLHFGRSRVRFFVTGGVGVLWADYLSSNPYARSPNGPPIPAEQIRGTQFAFNLGAGVKWRLVRGLALRPEFRMFDTTPGAGYNWTAVRFWCGLAYHF